MYSVKEAAAALGCDERWVREQLNQGQLKGEKKNIGMKEKWFVYKGEIDQALARKSPQTISAAAETTQTQFFGVDVDEAETIELDVEATPARAADNSSVAELVKIIANQFAEKLDQQKSVNFQLQRELEEKERQLKLLPDLQKRAEEANLKEFELEALRKQLGEVQQLKQQAEVDAQRAVELEQSIVPELREQVESERAAKAEALADLSSQLQLLEQKYQQTERAMNEERVCKGVEVERLQTQLAAAEVHKKAAEMAQEKIEELEHLAEERQQSAEEKEKALEELRRLQEQKDAQLAAMQEQIAELAKKTEKPKSWLRRFFLGGNS